MGSPFISKLQQSQEQHQLSSYKSAELGSIYSFQDIPFRIFLLGYSFGHSLGHSQACYSPPCMHEFASKLKLLMSLSKLYSENPEFLSVFPPLAIYDAYTAKKHEKRVAQQQRINAHIHVVQMERQLRRTVRELSNTQLNILKRANIHNQKEERQSMKQQIKSSRRQHEEEMRRTNRSLRRMYSTRKEQTYMDIMAKNKESVRLMKEKHRTLERRMSNQRLQEEELLRRRNEAAARSEAVNCEYSKAKSIYDKQCKSSVTTNSLIDVHGNAMRRQLIQIESLSHKQAELLQIVEKAKQEKKKLQELSKRSNNMSYQDICRSLSSERSIKSRHSRKK